MKITAIQPRYYAGPRPDEAIAEFLNNGFWEYLQKPRNAEG